MGFPAASALSYWPVHITFPAALTHSGPDLPPFPVGPSIPQSIATPPAASGRVFSRPLGNVVARNDMDCFLPIQPERR
jgi:hypothetical protein